MMGITAVLFDLGGTLLDFNPHGYAWLEWERIGLDNAFAFLSQHYPLDYQAFVAHFMNVLPHRWTLATQGKQNLTLGGLLEETCVAAGAAVPVPTIQAAIAHYVAPLDRQVVIYEDAIPTLETLHRRGLRLALISNSMWPGHVHRQQMARFGILRYFDQTFFSGDVAMWKPQPALYRLALNRLDILPEQALFVGDTPEHDLVGARAVGIKTVYKRNDAFKLDGFQPDAEITHLAELPALLNH